MVRIIGTIIYICLSLFVLFVYYVYLWCVSLFNFLNNKDKIMTKIFIFPHFGLNINHSFLICFYLERICLYNREIILAALLRQNSKTNMTKNCNKIVLFKNFFFYIIFLPYRHSRPYRSFLDPGTTPCQMKLKKTSFLAANTQDGFGEHRDKKCPMCTIKYTAVFFWCFWPIFLLEVLDILFRHMASWILSNTNR